jgi:hypothetical protein
MKIIWNEKESLLQQSESLFWCLKKHEKPCHIVKLGFTHDCFSNKKSKSSPLKGNDFFKIHDGDYDFILSAP